MNGEIPLETVYGERLTKIRPTADEINELANEYRRTLALGAEKAVTTLRSAGVMMALVSGGIRQAIEPVALDLGFGRDRLFAVDLRWDAAGEYIGFDERSPLTRQRGKLEVVKALALASPSLAVGDGATDVVMREATDAFAAFTGFARRASVVQRADFVVESYDQLTRRVLSR